MKVLSLIPKSLSNLGLSVEFDGEVYTAIDSDGCDLKTFEILSQSVEYLEDIYADYL